MGCRVSSEYNRSFNDFYQLGEKIGSGSIAQVRLCVLRGQTEQRVAKIVRKPYPRKDFDVEISILEEVNREECLNIVQYYEFFEDHHYFYSIMEHCSGGEFDSCMGCDDPISEPSLSSWIKQVLIALKHLHGLKIVHRDVKPQNILFKDNSRRTIKLIDFSLSYKLEAPDLINEPCGTLEFLAPEMILGKYGRKVDIWALGIVLYKMLYGRYPFNGCEDKDLFKNIIEQDPCWTYSGVKDYKVTIRPDMIKAFDSSKIFDTQKSKNCDTPRNAMMPPRRAVDFCKMLLIKNSKKRPTAAQALKHPWLVDPFNSGSFAENIIPSFVRRRAIELCGYYAREHELRKPTDTIDDHARSDLSPLSGNNTTNQLTKCISMNDDSMKLSANVSIKGNSLIRHLTLDKSDSNAKFERLKSFNSTDGILKSKIISLDLVKNNFQNLFLKSHDKPTRLKTSLFTPHYNEIDVIRESNLRKMFSHLSDISEKSHGIESVGLIDEYEGDSASSINVSFFTVKSSLDLKEKN